MKKLIRFLTIVLVASMLPVVAICQDGTGTSGFSPVSYFASLSALVTAVLGITQWLKTVIKSTGGWTVAISWAISFALALLGWLLNLGIFAGIGFYWVLAYGLGAGLVANRIFDMGIVTGLLSIFKGSKNA